MDPGIPPGIGIQLPPGTDARVIARDMPYNPAPAPFHSVGVIETPIVFAPASGSASTPAPYSPPFVNNLPPPGSGFTPGGLPPMSVDSAAGQAAFERAKNLMRNEQYEAALREIETALANGYATAEVYRWRGDGQYNLLRLREAVASYDAAIRLDPNNYFARRGRGLALLHRGYELHEYEKDARLRGDRGALERHFIEAHESYDAALHALRECAAERPNDPDTLYGLAMAAEGTSRAYYSLALSNYKNANRAAADAAATQCLAIINEGLKYALTHYQNFGKKERTAGPLTVAGGLFLRRALLQQAFGNHEDAVDCITRAINTQHTILNDIDPNHRNAQENLREYEAALRSMTGNI